MVSIVGRGVDLGREPVVRSHWHGHLDHFHSQFRGGIRPGSAKDRLPKEELAGRHFAGGAGAAPLPRLPGVPAAAADPCGAEFEFTARR